MDIIKESPTMYNSGKNGGGAAMDKISKWEYTNLFVGIGCIVLSIIGFIGGFDDPRKYIAPIIGMGFLSRFFKAYREAKGYTEEEQNTPRTASQQEFLDKVNRQRQKMGMYQNDNETRID